MIIPLKETSIKKSKGSLEEPLLFLISLEILVMYRRPEHGIAVQIDTFISYRWLAVGVYISSSIQSVAHGPWQPQ